MPYQEAIQSLIALLSVQGRVHVEGARFRLLRPGARRRKESGEDRRRSHIQRLSGREGTLAVDGGTESIPGSIGL